VGEGVALGLTRIVRTIGDRRWEGALVLLGLAVQLFAWAFPDLPWIGRIIAASIGGLVLVAGVITFMRKKKPDAAIPTDLTADVTVNATDGDLAEGLAITRPTRINPGTRVSMLTERIKKVVGIRIGGSEDE
jgi:hypothetical protein